MRHRQRRPSRQALDLLSLMLEHPTGDHYGLDLCKRAGLLSGTVYPMLKRLEDAGWLESRVEDIDPAVAGRPQRRLYRLTGDGVSAARAEINRPPARARRAATGLT